jgi:hypothetical protein
MSTIYVADAAADAKLVDAKLNDDELNDEYYQKKEDYREPEYPTYNWCDEEELSKYNYRKKADIHYLEVNPTLLEFVRDFNHAGGFLWSSDPLIDVLYRELGKENDSQCSFAHYLHELQYILNDNKKKYIEGWKEYIDAEDGCFSVTQDNRFSADDGWMYSFTYSNKKNN